MIQEENGVFHHQTETYSYLLKINTYCIPELGAVCFWTGTIPPVVRMRWHWNGAAAGAEFGERDPVRITLLSRKTRFGQFGSLLKHVVSVSINPNGQILWLADRHITLP